MIAKQKQDQGGRVEPNLPQGFHLVVSTCWCVLVPTEMDIAKLDIKGIALDLVCH